MFILSFYYLCVGSNIKQKQIWKRSIAHLPKRKQDDLYFLVKKVVERLPQTTMIILYSNYAKGGYVEYDERIGIQYPTSI